MRRTKSPSLFSPAWPAPRFSLGRTSVAAYCGPAGRRGAAGIVVRLEEEQPNSPALAMVDSPHLQARERSTPSQCSCASRSKPRPHNPSLNRTRIGMPPCPLSAHAYDALRGQRVTPLRAGYLQRYASNQEIELLWCCVPALRFGFGSVTVAAPCPPTSPARSGWRLGPLRIGTAELPGTRYGRFASLASA